MLERVLSREPARAQQFTGPQEATVLRVEPDGQLYAALLELPELEVGPCVWSRPAVTQAGVHTHTVTDSLDGGGTATRTTSQSGGHEHDSGLPPDGTGCLLLFTGTDLSRPWVVAFDGWPA